MIAYDADFSLLLILVSALKKYFKGGKIPE
jgi:hypothetical protein